MKLDIILVNYHVDPLVLGACLQSIQKSEWDGVRLARVVVVDNGGTGVLPPCCLPVSVYVQAQNLGFAKACNLGASKGDSPYILFLNPDVAVQKNTLAHAVRAMQADPTMGILGIDLRDQAGKHAPSRMNFPTFRHIVLPRRICSHFTDGKSGYCQGVLGAFFLVRRSVFATCPFDETFFLYYEEIDLCRRFLALGYRTYFAKEIHAQHIGGACSDRRVTSAYSATSRIYYAQKYLPPAKAWLAKQIIGKFEPHMRKVQWKAGAFFGKNH